MGSNLLIPPRLPTFEENSMKHVLIPTKLDSIVRELLVDKGFSVAQNSDSTLAELAAKHPQTEALLVRSEKVNAAIIDALPKLKVIIRAGAGYDTIDVKHARRRGVDVMNTPGANANAVAEEVVAMVLADYRHIVAADATTRQGLWEKNKYMGRELAHKTVGIVGLGNIGQLLAKRLQGFEVKVLAHDPVISATRADDLGARLVDLPTLFREADIISLHLPENEATRGLINRELLNYLKPGATIVNCARAGIIVEDDLRQAKATKSLRFLNDVYAADTAGAKSITDIADLMLPHLGASTHEANYNAARRAAEQLIAYVERGVTRYVVNRGVPEGLDEAYQQLAYMVALLARHYVGTEQSLRRVECSFYGDLHQYGKWFLAPITAGLSAEFDPMEDPQAAEDYLQNMGISFETRAVSNQKGYGNSLTVDLFVGNRAIQEISVRGTITEGNLMISRINDFDKLYFEPRGHSLIAVYRDRPGVLATITRVLAGDNINIDDIRSPHDSRTAEFSMAVLKVNKPVPTATVHALKAEINADVVFALSITD